MSSGLAGGSFWFTRTSALDQLARAAEKIDIVLTRGSEARLLAVLDPYNPKGSTRFVNFH
jgi:hypothetical protein